MQGIEVKVCTNEVIIKGRRILFKHQKYLERFQEYTTPSLSGKYADFARTKTCYILFLPAFHADFNHVTLEIIPWAKLEGSQS